MVPDDSMLKEKAESSSEVPMRTHEFPDPPIDEIRAVRHAISARFGHDPRKLVEYYMRLQMRHADRLVWSPGGREAVEEYLAAADDVA